MKIENMVKLSFIVPVYNVAPYLRKCVESLINQDYSTYEIILVDDGSTDESSKICDEFVSIDNRWIDDRYTIRVIHQKNGGLSAARNAGVKVAQGVYVCFVDSDDYWEENVLGGLMAQIERDNLDVLRFKYRNVREVMDEGMNGLTDERKYEEFQPYKRDARLGNDYSEVVTDGVSFLNSRMNTQCYAVMFIVRRDLLIKTKTQINTVPEINNENNIIVNQKSSDSVCCEQHDQSISADSVIVSELPLQNHPLSSDSVSVDTESSPYKNEDLQSSTKNPKNSHADSDMPKNAENGNAENEDRRLEIGDCLFTEGIYFEDTDWTPRMLVKARRVASADTIVYNYLVREGSITNAVNRSKQQKVLDDKMRLVGEMQRQAKELEQKGLNSAWFKRMIADNVISIIGIISRDFYEERKAYLEQLRQWNIYPIQSRALKARLINLSPRLAVELLHIKNG